MTVKLEPISPSEAIDFFRSKGLTPELNRFDWRDHWRQEHARTFVVAKAMRDDVLKAIRSEVDRAIAEGRTLDQFRRDLQPKLEAFGWWGRQLETDPLTGETREVQLGSPSRLRTIFDTNMRTSLA
ncbi:MAG: head morphogenesis protein, partial [Pseudomonadota bacterium]